MDQSKNNLIIVLLVAGAFLLGNLWFKVSNLEKNQKTGTATTQPADTTTQTGDTQAQQAAPTQAPVALNAIKALFGKDYISFGDANKKLLFVEISDPSCPFCHIAAGKNPELSEQVDARFKYKSKGGDYVPPVEEMKKLVDSGKAGFVWMYANGHGNGQLASQALYCANEKDKFWPVHDLLMTNKGYDLLNNEVKNDKTKSDKLADFLSSAVDKDFLTDCLKNGKYEKTLTRDEQEAAKLGFQGTPHFFVNEVPFGGAQNYSTMQSEVDKYL
ncbi:hypothetical protein A3J15_02215 [Candidatus Roizmanbacteria bacterium RIFCSPLOWO2_02_FULL_38_10]|uniref:Thioredoxin-like fold domain-containing protein n=1 Tax=Candidatus Roizmanbacteria bacterium RIFCSPLOWO2_02_FULL_38_10 TaxID=1802074 RepID=A0A1F7JM90_9BACT|nr:MAG: hypothetical protein A3J15_02215 [Candidatus Roizmanbacteria bacterium RIFCSPLOWO2_02_FULL_38_10]